jgi:UDP-2-acetamido-3-amino-2,3-dideoxy-glucuronate N-acetyltransferase
MSKFGERMDLPLMGEGKFTCPYTGDKYELKDGLVYLIPS